MNARNTGFRAYFRAPFVAIVWVMETYAKNRALLKQFMVRDRVANVFKIAIVVTVLIWLGIALTAKDEDGQRLTDAVKDFWSDTQDLSEQRKARQAEQEPAQ